MPGGRVPLVLGIMVGVKTHGRLALRCWEPTNDRRRSPGCTYNVNVGAPEIDQQLHDAFCAPLHLRRPGRIGAYRLNRDQFAQVGKDTGNLSLNVITQQHCEE